MLKLRRALVGGWTMVELLESRRLLTTIDVMVVYSNDALAGFGGSVPAIQQAIRQSMDFANLAHQNTQDEVVLRLVHTGLIDYTNPNGTQQSQLAALKANATVALLRNTHGADLVSMVIDANVGGGLGDLLLNPAGNSSQAFTVVDFGSIGPGSRTLAHEFGHNMGGGHEEDNNVEFASGVFPAYSYGYHTNYGGPSIHGTDYGDVMSYQGQTLPVFSNPSFIHDGAALGTASADLRTTFLATAPVIANYRATAPGNTGPAATLLQADVAGNQLTFKVRYTDDVAVNAATVGDGDAYVTTPEGFQLAAQFMGLDSAGNAYAKVATYRVTLPANLPGLSSLGFYLNGGQVMDGNGATVAGGLLAADLLTDFERGLATPYNAGDSGVLAVGSTRRVTGRVGDAGDLQDMHKFTVTANTNLSVRVTGVGGGLTSDPVLFIYRDANLNEVIDGGESLGNSFEGGTADKTKSLALTPGTYYAYLQLDAGDAATNYTMTLASVDPAADTTPPSAPVLEKADQAHVGTTSTLDFYVVFSDDVGIDANSVLSNGYLTFFNPSGSGIIKTPADVTVSGKSVIAHYNHTFGAAFGSGTVQIRLTNQAGFETKVKDLSGNLIVLPAGSPTNFGTYLVGTLPADPTNPTATVFSAPTMLVRNGVLPATYDFVIAYKDNRGINTGSLGTGDILVTGPAGSGMTNVAAAFQGFTVSPGGSTVYATYRVNAPGGSWDYTDNGAYGVTLAEGQVTDTAGRAATLSPTGPSFTVNIPVPGDADFDKSVGLNDLISLANHYGQAGGAGWSDGDFDYDGTVGLNDLIILANHYGTVLAAEGVADVGDGSGLVSADSAMMQGAGMEPAPAGAAEFNVVETSDGLVMEAVAVKAPQAAVGVVAVKASAVEKRAIPVVKSTVATPVSAAKVVSKPAVGIAAPVKGVVKNSVSKGVSAASPVKVMAPSKPVAKEAAKVGLPRTVAVTVRPPTLLNDGRRKPAASVFSEVRVVEGMGASGRA